MTGRDILIYLAHKYEGNVKEMIRAIEEKEHIVKEDADRVFANMKYKAVTILDDDYPIILREVYPPILCLFYYGDISLLKETNKNLAVVGSRDATTYGLETTNELVSGLVDRYNIVSGLARGIDACAHNACVYNKGKTIAVLGSGIDNCYPLENKKLYQEIIKNGLVVSEYPGAVAPNTWQFPLRNRIIAGVSRGILITEAKNRSGTLITVNWGQSLSKEIMCVPNRRGEDSGCNKLIRDGAALVETVNDIVYELDGISLDEK